MRFLNCYFVTIVSQNITMRSILFYTLSRVHKLISTVTDLNESI